MCSKGVAIYICIKQILEALDRVESIVSVVQEFRCLHTLEMKNVPLQSKSLTHARVYRLA